MAKVSFTLFQNPPDFALSHAFTRKRALFFVYFRAGGGPSHPVPHGPICRDEAGPHRVSASRAAGAGLLCCRSGETRRTGTGSPAGPAPAGPAEELWSRRAPWEPSGSPPLPQLPGIASACQRPPGPHHTPSVRCKTAVWQNGSRQNTAGLILPLEPKTADWQNEFRRTYGTTCTVQNVLRLQNLLQRTGCTVRDVLQLQHVLLLRLSALGVARIDTFADAACAA